MLKPTERFSDRVSNYLKYRPSYPPALIDELQKQCSLDSDSVIADIGSGTGKLSELLLARDFCVQCVEPNKEMRESAEALLGSHSGFTSIDGQSEKTGLADSSVDLITAAQAFHWFDAEKTGKEFDRILKSEGRIALIWNQRDTDQAFQREYDEMLTKYAPEYSRVNHRNINDSDIEAFYHPRQMKLHKFDYCQHFDSTAFIGRMNSSSYTPKKGTAEFAVLHDVAKDLFAKYEQNGKVEFSYQTNLYLSLSDS